MSVTLKEIAQRAGISFQAVSAVLNNSDKIRVSPEKRIHILKLVDELGYRPNLLARQLASKGNNIIGVIIDSMSPIFYRNVMMTVERMTSEKGFRLQVGLVHDSLESLKKYVDDFHGWGIENVICMAHSYPEFAQQGARLFDSFPNTVFMEEPEETTNRFVVSADHYAVYKEVAQYLISLNRTRIFNCRDIYKDKAFYASTQGFIDGYLESGVLYQDEFMFLYPVLEVNNYETAEQFIKQILPLKPDALILPNDEVVMWCYHILKDHKIPVPQQISLVSGDLWKFGKAFNPSLAGIEYNYEDIARRCVEIILWNMNKEHREKLVENFSLSPPRFHHGKSCCLKK